MDKIFLKNQKKPGDEGFVYDIQVEYAPFKENEWDEDEEIQKKERWGWLGSKSFDYITFLWVKQLVVIIIKKN